MKKKLWHHVPPHPVQNKLKISKMVDSNHWYFYPKRLFFQHIICPWLCEQKHSSKMPKNLSWQWSKPGSNPNVKRLHTSLYVILTKKALTSSRIDTILLGTNAGILVRVLIFFFREDIHVNICQNFTNLYSVWGWIAHISSCSQAYPFSPPFSSPQTWFWREKLSLVGCIHWRNGQENLRGHNNPVSYQE